LQINGRRSKTDLCNVHEHYYLPECTPFSLKCNFRCCEETDVCLLWVDDEEENHLFHLVHVYLTAGLASQKTGLYIHGRETFRFLLINPNGKFQFGSGSMYLVEWCGRRKGSVVGFCDNWDGFYGCITMENYHSLRDHTLCSLLFGRLARICTKAYVHFCKFSNLFYFTARVVDIYNFST